MGTIEQISPNEVLTDTQEASAGTRAERQVFEGYLRTFCLLFLVLYLAPLYLVRRANFDQWSGSPYSLPLNYAFKTAGMNADVVLFGDSTVMHGVDPSQMSAALGVKVVNLPGIAGTLRVVNDLALRRYLMANQPPRLIVFYLAPWDLDYAYSTYPVGTYDGRELLAHQGTGREILAYARIHPFQALEFPFQFYFVNARSWTIFEHPYREAGLEVARTQGHLTNPLQTTLRPDCEFPAAVTSDFRFDSVRALGERYRTAQTKILYFMAPVPDCRNVSQVLDHAYSALPAAPPRVLPASMFSPEEVVLHPVGSSVPSVTRNLTDAVRPLLINPKP